MKDSLVKWLVASNLLLVALVVAGGASALLSTRSVSTSALAGYADGEGFSKSEAAAFAPSAPPPPSEDQREERSERKRAAREQVMQKGLMGVLGGGIGGGGSGMGYGSGMASVGGKAKMAVGSIVLSDRASMDAPSAEPQRTRAWFPETFLFQPRLVTDANGKASLSVQVPDRLTTWRVLALAHSRDGAQAGTTSTFLGTLDAYVDPVVPPLLHAGDEVRLPIQLVNTTNKAVSQALSIQAAGARLSGAATSARIDAGASTVTWVTLRADEPGTATLEATLAGADKVVREIPVVPTGKPFEERRAGTLAAERELTLELPDDLDPKSARARLVVYPGALALLRSELASAGLRGGLADDAYALRLAGDAARLLADLGDDPDLDSLRTMSILATQRVLRAARGNDALAAGLLAEGALAHRGSPVLDRLATRLVQSVAAGQRPDGTCGGGPGWPLQRVLAATAECVRVVTLASTDDNGKRLAAGVSLKASGAVERHLALVNDPFTAAALVASGAAQGGTVEVLRAKIREAAKANDDGSKSLSLEAGPRRADGSPASQAEADALAILALDPEKDAALRADLGASLLARYVPANGWGDGRTNLAALRAAVALFKGGLPADVRVELLMDGRPLADGTLAGRARDALALDVPAPGLRGKHAFTIRATPPLPGLSYALELDGYVPWRAQPMQDGLELAITLPKALVANEPAQVSLEAAAPSGHALKLVHALPAGVQADRPSLEKLVEDGLVASFETADGSVTLHLAPRDVGETFRANYRVVPTLSGTLHASASSLALEHAPGTAHHVPPAVWTVR